MRSSEALVGFFCLASMQTTIHTSTEEDARRGINNQTTSGIVSKRVEWKLIKVVWLAKDTKTDVGCNGPKCVVRTISVVDDWAHDNPRSAT